MPSGGNWKDLFKAARDGDTTLVRYHLDQTVDPNYQHPEYFSSPLHEAVRHGRIECTRVLIEEGKANPALVEDLSDLTPLEIALEEKHHGVVDLLLTVLPRNEQTPCKRILIIKISSESLVKTLLEMGHQLWIEQSNPINVDKLKQHTGNQKLQVLPSTKYPNVVDVDVDLDVDVCILQLTSQDGKGNSAGNKPSSLGVNVNVAAVPRLVLIFDLPLVRDIAGALTRSPATTTAVLEPTSWWDQMTHRWWCDRWYNAIGWLATTESGDVCGKAYNHNRTILDLPLPKPRVKKGLTETA